MAPPSAPAVRATHLADDLRSLSVLGPGAEDRVRAQLSPASVRSFEVSSDSGTVTLEPRDPTSPDASWLVEWRRSEKG
jgi:hypothetical protein